MESPRETKYMEFRLMKSGRTQVWEVISKRHKVRLGVIKWNGAWFRYAFMPDPATLFDADCLGEIIRVLTILMKERGR